MSALGRELQALIRHEGPVTVERYMALCLSHPRHGYYVTRDPFGRAGDFTTAPEISQMFGELLGLWCAEVWARMGRPASFHLVEVGPGRGTLMADALRALHVVPDCLAALSVHLVETSPALRTVQGTRLATSEVAPTWHEAIEDLPPGPAIVIGNEFLDALPVRQFVRTGTGWHERVVGLDAGERLTFGLKAEPDLAAGLQGRPGDFLEIGEAASAFARQTGERLAADVGAALFVDYGHTRSGFGDTLQAVRQHAPADPLAEPGEADLTCHVDFAAIARAATDAGARVHGPTTQAAFLEALGIRERAAALGRTASAPAREALDAALNRLVGTGAHQMGALFKVIGLGHPALDALPGLPPAAIRAEQRATALPDPAPC